VECHAHTHPEKKVVRTT